AVVENTGRTELPFGLGYHPYFCADFGQCLVEVPARSTWELDQNLPTGRRVNADSARDLRTPRRFDELQLDNIYTDLDENAESGDLGILRGQLTYPGHGRLRIWTSKSFREMVVFTPPHRKAICLEPYTCTTDAVNLQARGIDAGWQSLPPEQS